MSDEVKWQDLLEAHGFNELEIHRDEEPIDTSWRNVLTDPPPMRNANRLIEKVLQVMMPAHLGI